VACLDALFLRRQEEQLMYEVRFSEDAERHLKGFAARERKILLDAIEEQLVHQPTVATRNRKLLRENPTAAWELSVQAFRVLYNVEEAIVTVLIVAIAVKDGNKYVVEGEEFQS
jgi:mRNA-degrading endonuclease RelE of RelBE toxin-antitoxin system